MWIPSWLGTLYSRLYTQLKCQTFTFKEALEATGLDPNRLAVAFSKLHSKRILLVFQRSRPRVYRLLDPESFLLLSSEVIQQVTAIRQERYLNLICQCFEILHDRYDLASLALYGSVERGEAGPQSDVDFLVVSDDFRGSLASRIDELAKVEGELHQELKFLSERQIYSRLSLYPMRREEAGRLPLLFLDLTEEALILYDQEGFLRSLLAKMRSRLLENGGRRVQLQDGRWYWDLKPNYKFPESIRV